MCIGMPARVVSVNAASAIVEALGMKKTVTQRGCWENFSRVISLQSMPILRMAGFQEKNTIRQKSSGRSSRSAPREKKEKPGK
jgi:hypothetical protein